MSEHTHISRRPCLHLTVTNLPVALAIVDPIGIFASTRDFPKTPRTQAVRDYWLAGCWTFKNVAGWPVLGPGLLIKLIVANT